MMESIDEFKKRVRKLSGHRVYRVRNSYGVYDAYKWYRRHKPEGHRYVLEESQYFSIIRQVNNMLAKEIALGNEVNLPHRMGSIQLRKFNRKLYVDDKGKLVTNLPVDWDSTLRLWYEDREAYRAKTLVRLEEKELFKICYIRFDANYNNKSFYDIAFNKCLRTELKKNIKAGLVDAFLMRRRNR